MSFELKYAPRNISEIVLPNVFVKSEIDNYIAGRNLRPLILCGSFGTGKTTLAKHLPDAIEGKSAQVDNFDLDEFKTVSDIAEKFKINRNFYRLFSINNQKRNYIIFNEAVFSSAAGMKLRNVLDETMEQTQFIFTTNDLHSFDKGVRDRSTVLSINISDANAWLSRAQSILQAEGVNVPDSNILAVVNSALRLNGSNREVLKRLEDLINQIKHGSVSAASLPPVIQFPSALTSLTIVK